MFSIVIPLYNEAQNINELLREIKQQNFPYKNFEIILVDDCSIDDTIKVIKENNDLSNIQIIKNNENRGQSYSILKGIKKSSYDIIVTIDGDGQNNPRDILKLLKIYLSDKEIKLVGGIRSNRKDKILKIISSKIANFIRSKIFNDDCKDTGCSLKVFDKKSFLEFPFFNGIHRFLPALFKGFGHKTTFYNVDHRERKFGYSKYGTLDRLFRGVRDIFVVLKIIKNKKIK